MTFKRMMFSWLLMGTVAALPGILTGCSSTSMDRTMGHDADSHPASLAQADHMTMMELGPKDETFDLRFIDGMILHHQGAIAMAKAALQNSQRDEVKQLAQEIIAAQQREIDQMQQWRQAWYPDADAEPVMYHGEMGHEMAMTPEMQAAMRMDGDLGKADAEFDRRFIDAMIPHHRGALMMAEQVLERSDRPELKQVAQDILTSQQAEIDQMQQWRKAWYGE